MRTDEQLVESIRRGKTSALDELYARYARSLYAFCASMTRAREPEDMVHDIFVRLIERIDRFHPHKASFRAWLFSVARNYCIDLARREGKFQTVSLEKPLSRDHETGGLTLQDTLADERENAEQLLARRSEIDAVRDCVQQVQPEEERQAVMSTISWETCIEKSAKFSANPPAWRKITSPPRRKKSNAASKEKDFSS